MVIKNGGKVAIVDLNEELELEGPYNPLSPYVIIDCIPYWHAVEED